MPNLTAAHASANEAMAAMAAVDGWPNAPRPVHSVELLPERALNGDPSATTALIDTLVRPLAKGGPTLATTLETYLDTGGSVEACARELFIHPNTVRYRLKKVAELTGRDPTHSRDGYVLRIAATVGRLTHFKNESSSRAT